MTIDQTTSNWIVLQSLQWQFLRSSSDLFAFCFSGSHSNHNFTAPVNHIKPIKNDGTLEDTVRDGLLRASYHLLTLPIAAVKQPVRSSRSSKQTKRDSERRMHRAGQKAWTRTLARLK